MQVLGLTGGISSGKSTVRRILEEEGAVVLDADAIYHELIKPIDQQPSELAKAIQSAFSDVLKPDGTLDRKTLGRHVFFDAIARSVLNTITHPAVEKEFQMRVGEMERQGVLRVIYDVPLLFEAGLEKTMAGVIVVWVPKAVQLARLMARDPVDEKAALARINSQLSLDEKRARATWVIDNSGTVPDTEKQVKELWRKFR